MASAWLASTRAVVRTGEVKQLIIGRQGFSTLFGEECLLRCCMQLILAWNMHALTYAHVIFVVIVWSLFGQSVTVDRDQLKKDLEEAKQQLQFFNDTLGKFL